MSKPKILLWDIESCYNIVVAHAIYKGYFLSPNDIIQERFLISGAWKWYGQKRVHAVSLLDDPKRFKRDHTDDYWVVSQLYGVVSEADAIVAHYGDNFDIKMLNARMIYHGFPPLPQVIQIDTWKMAKAKFKFNSNKLDYIAKYLGHEGKMPTPPGLWHRVLNGERKAIKEMVAYNKQDIEVLEFVFEKLKPFVPARINHQLFADRPVCPVCGSEHINYKGYTYTGQRKYRRYVCMDCGHNDRERKAVYG